MKILLLNVVKLYLLVFLLIFPSLSHTAVKETFTFKQTFTTETIKEINGIPWGMTWLGENQLLFTLREGKAGVLNTDTRSIQWLEGLPKIYVKGQGGLLDVATQNNYKQDDWIYFTYSKPNLLRDTSTTLARATLNGSKLSQWQDLLTAKTQSDGWRHFGSRIAFDDNGHVFFSVGDHGIRPNGQNLQTHSGSIIRLNLDGSIPADNPFVNNKNALPEIYSYGHRNPQGLCYEKHSNTLWSSEHGPRGGDEINIILPGRNYGWPVVSHGKEYNRDKPVSESTQKTGMEDPLKIYIPSIAPGSLLCYAGNAHFPQWQNSLFLGALALRHLNRVEIKNNKELINEERLLGNMQARIRSLLEGPDGEIYVGIDGGKILRIESIKSTSNNGG